MKMAMRWGMALAFGCMAYAAGAADWWVDSLGTGDGTSSGTPTNSIQGAINAASPGDTINVRGATGRLYTNNAYTIAKRGVSLVGWEGKPLIQLNGASDNINRAVVWITTNDVTLRNIRFEIDKRVLGSSDSLILISNKVGNITIDGIEGRATNGLGGAYNAGYIVEIYSPAYDVSNCVVRNCRFSDWGYNGWQRPGALKLCGLSNSAVANVFSNVDRAIDCSGNGGTGGRYCLIQSNLFLNCTTEGQTGTNDTSRGIIFGGYDELKDYEISYNIAWNNNGKRPVFLLKGRSALKTTTRIFNNTMYNYLRLFSAIDVRTGEGCSPLVVNNLLLSSSGTNIMGDWVSTNAALVAGSYIGYNAWDGALPLIETNTVSTNLITLTNNYNIAVTLINSTDPSAPKFMQPHRDSIYALRQAYGLVNSNYPAYIGAVDPGPVVRGTLVVIQ